MSRFTVIQKINSVTKSIEDYLDQLEKLRGEDHFSEQWRRDQAGKLQSEFRVKFISGLKDFIDNYLVFKNELKLREETEKLAYKPVGTMEEILFYEKKKDLQQYLESLTFEQLFKVYEEEISSWRLRSQEEIIPLLIKDMKPGQRLALEKLINDKQSQRVRQATKEDIQFLQEKKDLYNFAERNLPEVEGTFPEVQGKTLHTWLGISKQRSDKTTANRIQQLTNRGLQQVV